MDRRALFISPHTDDAELGAGATMARLVDEGWDVACVALSIAEDVVPGPDSLILHREFEQAMLQLGLGPDRFRTMRYPVRRFAEQRQDILDSLIALRTEFVPNLVVIPSSDDLHQDHEVVHAEGLRAFRNGTIWGLVLPWNHMATADRRFVEIGQDHLDTKLKMLGAYRSQIDLGRSYFRTDYTVSRAQITGQRIGVRFAESFELIREVDFLD